MVGWRRPSFVYLVLPGKSTENLVKALPRGVWTQLWPIHVLYLARWTVWTKGYQNSEALLARSFWGKTSAHSINRPCVNNPFQGRNCCQGCGCLEKLVLNTRTFRLSWALEVEASELITVEITPSGIPLEVGAESIIPLTPALFHQIRGCRTFPTYYNPKGCT